MVDSGVRVSALVASAVVAVLAATTHRHGVSTTDLIAGSVGAGMMLGALPACSLGWGARSCAASAVPVGYYYLGWILTLSLTNCPPDAYECPV